MSTPEIKALFFDIDGTLACSSTHQIPVQHIESFQALHEKGYLLFTATGRDLLIPEEAEILEPLLPYLSGFIDVNGQHCALADGTEISSHPLDDEDFFHLRSGCEAHHISMLYRRGHTNYLTELTEHVKRYWNHMGLPIPEIRPMDPGYHEVPKLCIHASPEEEAAWLTPHIHHTWTARITEDMIDIIPEGIGKSSGIREVCDYFGIRIEQTMAFGDGMNDLDMIRAAGIGVAMVSGKEIVKKYASFVTASPEEGGITLALQHFGLL